MFEIAWNLSETEWEKAQRASLEHEAGSQYDRECSAHYYLLYATLAMRSDGSSLFERDGTDAVSVSVLDIGYQLARVLADVERTGRGQFSASDDDIEVSFALEAGGGVAIATNHFASKLRVPVDEFRRGCERFLSTSRAAFASKPRSFSAGSRSLQSRRTHRVEQSTCQRSLLSR